MSKQLNKNSILVLATLGVYFGLVLAGAAPQVLANAAMARSFDIKDEVEIRDGLDDKPDDERSAVLMSVQLYLEDVEYFLASLGKFRTRGKFDPEKDRFDVAQSAAIPCVDSAKAGRYTPVRFISTSGEIRGPLDWLGRGMSYGYSLGDCLSSSEFTASEAVNSDYSYKLDSKELVINVAIKKRSPQNAAELVRRLEAALAVFAAKQPGELREIIIRTTAITADNDQVFIVTRLPRAGLDRLLALGAR